MVDTSPDDGSRGRAPRAGGTRSGSSRTKKNGATAITNVRRGNSREIASREKRYAITMGIRTACFISMIFVPGGFRWVLLAGAVFLPYVAVVLANQANTRTGTDVVVAGSPGAAPQLTAGPVDAEVIEGELIDGARIDGQERTDRDEDDDWTRRERVA